VPLPRAFPALSGLAPKKDCPFPRKSRTSRNLRGPEAKFVRTLAPDRRDALARDISVTRAWARAVSESRSLSLRGRGGTRLLNKSPPSPLRCSGRGVKELEYAAAGLPRRDSRLSNFRSARSREHSRAQWRESSGGSHPPFLRTRGCSVAPASIFEIHRKRKPPDK